MRTILFTGSRGWQDRESIILSIDSWQQPFRGVVGDAKGFDALVWDVLGKRNLPRVRFKAKWRENGYYDKGAGHARNRLMLAWLKRVDADGFVIAGWDGVSTGTSGCMDDARRLGIPVFPIQYIRARNEG